MKSQATKNILVFSMLLVFIIMPVLASAEIIPDCSPNCGYYDLIKLVNNIIKWIIITSVPVAAGVFAWAGINMMMHAGNPGKRKESIDMMKKVFFGFVFILAAWIIVGTITKALLNPDIKIPVDVGINKSINLYI